MDKKVEQMLYSIGLTPNYKGYRQLVQALQIAVEEPEALEAVTKWLYPRSRKEVRHELEDRGAKHTDNDRDSLADCSRTTGEAVRLLFGEKAEAGTISCVLNLSFIPYPVVFLSIWLKMWYNKEKRGGSTVQLKYHILTIEDLVPVGHFLRKLEAVLDLSFVYEETAGLYSRKYGRPPIDPVVLVKYLLVGYLYGIPSERQIEQRIQTDVALRWYLGIDLLERVPDHSTISQLRRRKPAFRKVFRRLFERVVNQCIEEGLVSGRLVLTDSTHVKANASRASEEQIEMPESPGAYWKRLDTYEEEGLEELKRRTGNGEKSAPGKSRRTAADEKAGQPDRSRGRTYETPGEAAGAILPLPSDSGQRPRYHCWFDGDPR